MSSLPVLAYWDIRGLVSPIRYLLAYAGQEHEYKTYSIGPGPDWAPPEWLQDKETLGFDFPNLPYYIDGDVKLTQSLTILRHLARKFDLVSANEDETLRIELAEQQATDLRMSFIKVAYSQGEDFDKGKATLLEALPKAFSLWSKFLGDRKFVAGDRLTFVDFIVYDALDFNRLFAGEELLDQNLKDYLARVEGHEKLADYFATKHRKLPICGPMSTWGGQSE